LKTPVILRVFKNDQLIEVRQFDGDQIVIGHDADVQLDLDHESISPIHCLIERRDDSFYVCDLGSKAGTFKNGQAILDEILSSGDDIRVGPFKLSFFLGAPKPRSTPSRPLKPAATPASTSTPAVTPASSSSPKKVSPVTEAKTTTGPKIPKSKVAPSAGGVGVNEPARPEIKSPILAVRRKTKNKKTFAPPNQIKDLKSFFRPTKGNSVEVMVAWQERIIGSYHFKAGVVRASDLNLPKGVVNSNQALLEIRNGVSVFVGSDMICEISNQKQRLNLDQALAQGQATRGSTGASVKLDQGDVIFVTLGGGQLQLIIRFVPSTPIIPLLPPFLMSNEEVTGLILSLVLVGLLWFTVSATTPRGGEDKSEEIIRVAQVVFTNPIKPPPEEKLPVPPPAPPVKQPPPPPPQKAVVSDRKTETQIKGPVTSKPGGAPVPLKAVEVAPIPNSKGKPKKFTSVRSGGGVKIGTQAGANAQSAKDVTKMGLFSAFGGGGIRQKVDEAYSGAGQLLGQADRAGGTSGMSENREGEDLGSKIKSTGAGGKGTATQGIAGIGTKGRATGMSAYGSSEGFGDKTSVNIEPGGAEANFHGTIDKEAVRRVVLNNLNQIRGCFGRELNKLDLAGRTKLEGKVMVTWEIVAKGVPRNVTIKSSTLNNRAVENCIRDRLASWVFPEPPVGMTADVAYPFYLRPGN
jgi:pSer/pThr/pTyr-binding forkhead associated (FHA) protein